MGVGTATALALGGASVLGAREQSKAAKRAGKAQEKASEQAITAEQQALERVLGTTEPFRETSLSAAQPLKDLLFEQRKPVSLPGAEILENPLLKSIQDDVTQRLFANRAARGVLGSGGTADALFTSLAPTALNLGFQLQAAEEAQKQQQIGNLFNLLGLGANVAGGQGTAIQQTGQGVSQALQRAGQAQSEAQLLRGEARAGGISDLAGIGFLGSRGYFTPTVGK